MLAVEAFGQLVGANAGCHGEGPNVILARAIDWRDEIGKRIERGLAFALPLLAQSMKAATFFTARLVSVHDDVVALARGGPEAVYAAGSEQFFVDDALE